MPNDKTPYVYGEGSAVLSAPHEIVGSDAAIFSYAFDGSFEISPSIGQDFADHLQGRVFRVMDGQIFVVDPGSPPPTVNQ